MFQTKSTRQLAIGAATGAVVVVLAVVGWMHFQESDSHGHGDHGGPAQLVLNDGKKWATDEPLRQGMQRIDALVTPVQAVSAEQSLDPAQAKVIAEGVKGQVTFLVNNCKLEPKADAALHVLIADMLEGSEALSEAAPSGRGIVLIRQALQRYPEYFETAGAPR